MTAQKNHANRRPAIRMVAHGRRRGTATKLLLTAAVMGCVVPAVGCKTGTSLTKPSWLTFGGTPKAAADSLASAPPYGGDIKKPSESAKQYPTTSTPSGYVITGTGSPAGTAAPQFEAAQSQAPVVYGTTPPSQPMPAAAVAAVPAAAATQQPAQSSSSIAPQVGPYAPLAGDSIPPPGQPLPPISPSTTPSMASGPGMSSTPAEASLPNTAYSNFSPPSATAASAAPPGPRMADARAADPAATIPAAALPVEAAAYGASRYSAGTGSSFSGGESASFPPSSATPQASYASPAEPGLPAPAAVSPFAAPPASSPSPAPAAPGLLQPSAQPVRRPDPVYRPGNTSSYRPSRTILAEDAPPSPAAVRTASYEEPAVTIQQ